MTHTITRVAGVDIAKAHLDIALYPAGQTRRFANDPAGIRKLLSVLKTEKAQRVVFEPTGPFHRPLEEALAEAGIAFVRVNPERARRFAEATGTLAKTDRIDARGLARMGAVLDLAPTLLPSPARQRLKELASTRRALVDAATAERNRLGATTEPLCRRLAGQRIAQLSRHIARIEREIEAVIAADPDLARQCDLLATIPGVGRLTAAVLLAEMPELGTMEARQAASLAGLAPIADDSGARRGRRVIRGGRATLRQALYMPAVSAIRHDPVMHAFYERLRAAGKPAKLALTAVMRKLVITANAIIRDGRAWRENAA